MAPPDESTACLTLEMEPGRNRHLTIAVSLADRYARESDGIWVSVSLAWPENVLRSICFFSDVQLRELRLLRRQWAYQSDCDLEILDTDHSLAIKFHFDGNSPQVYEVGISASFYEPLGAPSGIAFSASGFRATVDDTRRFVDQLITLTAS